MRLDKLQGVTVAASKCMENEVCVYVCVFVCVCMCVCVYDNWLVAIFNRAVTGAVTVAASKACKCMDDYRPHIHYTDPTDLAVKSVALGGVDGWVCGWVFVR